MEKDFLPIGLEEDMFKLVSTSTIPMYTTKHLGLTQYTPNRVTSYLTNYNEDMRKIDSNSASIAAGIIKILEDSAVEHTRLWDRIDATNSVLAFAETRIDQNASDIVTVSTAIAKLRMDTASDIAEAENRINENIANGLKATSSVIAYLENKVDETNTKTELRLADIDSRLHVAEDEIVDIKTDLNAKRTDIDTLKTDVRTLTGRITANERNILNHQATIDDLIVPRINGLTTKVESLEATDAIQNAQLNDLTSQVAAMNSIGADVNKLKDKIGTVFYLKALNLTGGETYDLTDATGAIRTFTVPVTTKGDFLASNYQNIFLNHANNWLDSTTNKAHVIILKFRTSDSSYIDKYAMPLMPHDRDFFLVDITALTMVANEKQIHFIVETDAAGFTAPITLQIIARVDAGKTLTLTAGRNCVIHYEIVHM